MPVLRHPLVTFFISRAPSVNPVDSFTEAKQQLQDLRVFDVGAYNPVIKLARSFSSHTTYGTRTMAGASKSKYKTRLRI